MQRGAYGWARRWSRRRRRPILRRSAVRSRHLRWCVFAPGQRWWPEMGYARFARFCTGFALWYGLRSFVRSLLRRGRLLRSLLYEEAEASTLQKRAQRAYKSERSERAKANAVSVPQVSAANEHPIRAAPSHEST